MLAARLWYVWPCKLFAMWWRLSHDFDDLAMYWLRRPWIWLLFDYALVRPGKLRLRDVAGHFHCQIQKNMSNNIVSYILLVFLHASCTEPIYLVMFTGEAGTYTYARAGARLAPLVRSRVHTGAGKRADAGARRHGHARVCACGRAGARIWRLNLWPTMDLLC